jgi:hypothetical protein
MSQALGYRAGYLSASADVPNVQEMDRGDEQNRLANPLGDVSLPFGRTSDRGALLRAAGLRPVSSRCLREIPHWLCCCVALSDETQWAVSLIESSSSERVVFEPCSTGPCWLGGSVRVETRKSGTSKGLGGFV